MINYLTAQEVLTIHAKIIDAAGGSHGVRDVERIGSMIERPKQQYNNTDLYKTIFDKAAVYFEVSAFHHPFVDGNKRTAFATATRFLFKNKYTVIATNADVEIFVVDAIVKKYNLSIIAEWFIKHSELTK